MTPEANAVLAAALSWHAARIEALPKIDRPMGAAAFWDRLAATERVLADACALWNASQPDRADVAELRQAALAAERAYRRRNAPQEAAGFHRVLMTLDAHITDPATTDADRQAAQAARERVQKQLIEVEKEIATLHVEADLRAAAEWDAKCR